MLCSPLQPMWDFFSMGTDHPLPPLGHQPSPADLIGLGTGSDTICNGPVHPLVDIVRFGSTELAISSLEEGRAELLMRLTELLHVWRLS